MARLLALLLAALTLAPLAAAVVPPLHAPGAVPVGVPREADPDVRAVTLPDAVVTVFQDEHWVFTEGTRTRTMQVPLSPTGAWDRIVLVFREYPGEDPDNQDPWDRLCSAAIARVEVLRCTTPRADFTLRRDVTEYAGLMPPGAPVPVSVTTGTWVGDGLWVTLTMEFYTQEPTAALVPPAAPAVVSAWYYRTLCANNVPLTAPVQFPASAPRGAEVEVTLSGHGTDEFYYLQRKEPVFHVLVDGTEVAQVWAMPWTYAFIGFFGGGYTIHPLMWWTAQRYADEAGLHWGTGEVPQYRATLLDQHLPLLQGARTVTLVGENGSCYWPSSLSFLLR